MNFGDIPETLAEHTLLLEDIPDSVGSMLWKESDAMKERTKFALEWERRWHENEGRVNVCSCAARSASAAKRPLASSLS